MGLKLERTSCSRPGFNCWVEAHLLLIMAKADVLGPLRNAQEQSRERGQVASSGKPPLLKKNVKDTVSQEFNTAEHGTRTKGVKCGIGNESLGL